MEKNNDIFPPNMILIEGYKYTLKINTERNLL